MDSDDATILRGLISIAPPAKRKRTVMVRVTKINSGMEFVADCRSSALARKAIYAAHSRWQEEAAAATASEEIRRRIMHAGLEFVATGRTAFVALEPWGFVPPDGSMLDTGSTPTEFRERCLVAYQAPLSWSVQGCARMCQSVFEVELEWR
jgi:hypothetical protein